jgi:hypothetical protein
MTFIIFYCKASSDSRISSSVQTAVFYMSKLNFLKSGKYFSKLKQFVFLSVRKI